MGNIIDISLLQDICNCSSGLCE